jgi:hypothetical protein
MDKLGLVSASNGDPKAELFRRFGVTGNPFPPAGQPSGHPHLDIGADAEIIARLRSFLADQHSQVIVVSGEQGVGKTNLLSHYDTELRKLASSRRHGNYIVHYYSDPEPSFDGVLRRLLQELGESYFANVARRMEGKTPAELASIYDRTRNRDLQAVLRTLAKAETTGESNQLKAAAQAAFEWVTGSRLLKLHRELLGVYYRLDTLESKTQVLRDLMEVGDHLGIVRGVLLLLDELEKQGYTTSKTAILRFLLAIRALIDALPRHLFLLVALTPTAKNRYFQMLPAVQSRMQKEVRIESFAAWSNAETLYQFYMSKARESARIELPNEIPGEEQVLTLKEAHGEFDRQFGRAAQRGAEGVTPRDLLEGWHARTQEKIAAI